MPASTKALHIKASGPDAGQLVDASGLQVPIWIPYQIAADDATPVAGSYAIIVAPANMVLHQVEAVHQGTALDADDTFEMSLIGPAGHAFDGTIVPAPRDSEIATGPTIDLPLTLGQKVTADIGWVDGGAPAATFVGLTLWMRVSFPL